MSLSIPFNQPHCLGPELDCLHDAICTRKQTRGDGFYTQQCHELLEQYSGAAKALLVHSGTAALEMAALLLDIKEGDEIIMPSFTFVSTANAFVLRGGVPVFVDITPDTQNMDASLIEAAITEKTKAICVVHYAGMAVDMDAVMGLAAKHQLYVVEDAAQALGSRYKGKALGSIGHLGCFSFHETKNIISGEGGALLINDEKMVERAEILREKGTNRSLFFRGQVDKYTWVDIGSSYLPSEMIAAYLYPQLQQLTAINAKRLSIWDAYHAAFAPLEEGGLLRRPVIPADCEHNAHMYYLMLPSLEKRTALIEALKAQGILSVFHYIPLHSAPAGQRFARTPAPMPHTDNTSDTLLRLPLYYDLTEAELQLVIDTVRGAL